MQQRSLGQTDLEVSSIGLGCVTFGREIDRETSFEILDHALERGINLLDTAAVYADGASENVLGEWMSERGTRDQVVLATKVTGMLSKEFVLASAEDSLRRLKCDCIDLFQLHCWDEVAPVEETLEALAVLVEQGKVRYVGCSNWSAEQLSQGLVLSDRVEKLPRMESVQPPYNLVQRDIETDLLPLCQDEQVGVLAYSPLGAGFLTGKYRRDGEVPEGTRFDVIPGHQPIYFTEEGFAVVDELRQAAETSGKSMIELALAWAISRSGVSSVLIGARNRTHVDQAFLAEELLADESVTNLLEKF